MKPYFLTLLAAMSVAGSDLVRGSNWRRRSLSPSRLQSVVGNKPCGTMHDLRKVHGPATSVSR
jgi:hypothetical protein